MLTNSQNFVYVYFENFINYFNEIMCDRVKNVVMIEHNELEFEEFVIVCDEEILN